MTRTADEIIDLICKASAKAVARYVEISEAKGPNLTIPEFYLPSFTFTELGSQFVMTLELNKRTLRNYGELESAPIRAGRVDLAVFADDAGSGKLLSMLIEYKLWNPEHAQVDLDELREIQGLINCPAVAICCLVNAGVNSIWMKEREGAELNALPGAKFVKHGVPHMHGFEDHSVYAVLFCGLQRQRDAFHPSDHGA